jgi:hypothetical protein
VGRAGHFLFILLLLFMSWWEKGAWKGESLSVQAVGWMTEKMWFDCCQGPEIFYFS